MRIDERHARIFRLDSLLLWHGKTSYVPHTIPHTWDQYTGILKYVKRKDRIVKLLKLNELKNETVNHGKMAVPACHAGGRGSSPIDPARNVKGLQSNLQPL